MTILLIMFIEILKHPSHYFGELKIICDPTHHSVYPCFMF